MKKVWDDNFIIPSPDQTIYPVWETGKFKPEFSSSSYRAIYSEHRNEDNIVPAFKKLKIWLGR